MRRRSARFGEIVEVIIPPPKTALPAVNRCWFPLSAIAIEVQGHGGVEKEDQSDQVLEGAR
ncbi:hypothetical protein pRL70129 (plasmid) [Rhizobium johnstonii 3841]|uniref:Uncharacterized protein n=1 Tax=Rhizobium johnstonii (strain DSM 114642 / LMG 32736 / 3841) TaxID=216596 RepID=Q1M9Q5_RHIJ3|nr:hypothetical protein pRL70129 [Rhizobium johnstonii 3841]